MADEPLRLEWRSPAELAENPRNWRRHGEAQMSALTDVLAEVGWAGACLYNERTGRLIDGHARKKVALEQGAEKVPVLVGSWDEAQEAKILATLDPLGAMATADAAALDALLRDVQTGSEAVGAMLAHLAEEAGVAPALPEPGGGGDDFDAGAALEGECRVKPGDLWLVGGAHRLLCGDSTKAGDVARLLGGETPFLMVTDPPYGVAYDPEWRDAAQANLLGRGRERIKCGDDRPTDWSGAFELGRADVAYCWAPGGAQQYLTQQMLEKSGFLVRQQIVWVKPMAPLSRSAYHWRHEPCWYAVRKGQTARWAGGRAETTVWEVASPLHLMSGSDEESTVHPTQKPLECMARPIRNHGAEGDVVYDPFLGSGTTLVAAHRLGRRCFGAEIEPKYVEVALRRAEAEGLSCERDVR